MKTIVLASTSPFRAELLGRLGLEFEIAAPDCDETPLPSELPADLVSRLSVAKARSLSAQYPDALIIGSDQVATRDGLILGKPHTHENAVNQLTGASGKIVTFHTGLCLYDGVSDKRTVEVEHTRVHFRKLSAGQIERYLLTEKPYNCAGSFKSEGLGVSLFERVDGGDPAALIGLPLIRLTTMLNAAGVNVP